MWALRSGHEHNFVDGRTHVHHIHLYNSVTGGEHNLQLLLGCPTCPSCHRPFERDDLSEFDPAAEINRALETLKANHGALLAYAEKHGHPIKCGELAHALPQGYRETMHAGRKFIHAPAKVAK